MSKYGKERTKAAAWCRVVGGGSTDSSSVPPVDVFRQSMPCESPQLATMRRSPRKRAAIAVEPSFEPVSSVTRHDQPARRAHRTTRA
jgi:hypothetical protein